MNKLLLIGTFLVLSFGCCGTLIPDNNEIEYVVYETDTYLIECPEDWNILTYNVSLFGEEYFHTEFVSKREGPQDTFLDAMEISSTEKPEPMTFDEFEAFEMRLMFEGDEFVMKEPINFAGQNALLLVSHGNIDGTEVTYHAIYFQYGGRMYRIQSASERDKQEKYAPIFQRMKDSFELKGTGSGSLPVYTRELEALCGVKIQNIRTDNFDFSERKTYDYEAEGGEYKYTFYLAPALFGTWDIDSLKYRMEEDGIEYEEVDFEDGATYNEEISESGRELFFHFIKNKGMYTVIVTDNQGGAESNFCASKEGIIKLARLYAEGEG